MPLHNLTAFIYTKTSTLTFPSKPSATISPSPIFRRLQSFFTVRMIEDCGGIFGLVSPWPWIVGRLFHSPNIVGDFGYGWVFWQHGRKLWKACAMVLLNYIVSNFGRTGSVRRIIWSFSTDTTPLTRLKYLIASSRFAPSGILMAIPGTML